jgi:hypothetical protein
MILIEKEIVFLSVPKCASVSIHDALEMSDLEIEATYNLGKSVKMVKDTGVNKMFASALNPNYKIKTHRHLSIAGVYTYLRERPEIIFVKRDYCKRFISAFNYLFNFWIPTIYPGIVPSLKFVDNDFIYRIFTRENLKHILYYDETSQDPEMHMHPTLLNQKIMDLLNSFTKEKVEINKNDYSYGVFYKMLDSQEFWKSGYTPKHIFDIGELDRLENFLLERYGKRIEIGRRNTKDHMLIRTNIVEDTKLRNWVWDNFEKNYFTKKIF